LVELGRAGMNRKSGKLLLHLRIANLSQFITMFYNLNDSDIRNICKEKIESLEYWLRRLVDQVFTKKHGSAWADPTEDGSSLIKKSIYDGMKKRTNREPNRYPRFIDAALLDDVIDIICNPKFYNQYFSEALKVAFPNGSEVARTYLKRLSEPRNNLAHANSISNRQAEQIICYSNDIIESIKMYYNDMNLEKEYNVPLILKLTDSLGGVFYRNQMGGDQGDQIAKNFIDDPKYHLRPGDTLTLEVEIDPAFSEDNYKIEWAYELDISNKKTGKKYVLNITERYVTQRFAILCSVTQLDQPWHRLGHWDDMMHLYYKILPKP
jgi:hypothetical protein